MRINKRLTIFFAATLLCALVPQVLAQDESPIEPYRAVMLERVSGLDGDFPRFFPQAGEQFLYWQLDAACYHERIGTVIKEELYDDALAANVRAYLGRDDARFSWYVQQVIDDAAETVGCEYFNEQAEVDRSRD